MWPTMYRDIWKQINFKIGKDDGKNALWAPHLLVGRRYEPNIGYISKIDGEQNSDSKKLYIKISNN